MQFDRTMLASLAILFLTHNQFYCASENPVRTYEQDDDHLCNPNRIDRSTQEVVEPSMIVVNYSMQPTALESAVALKKGRASVHYMIDKDGTIYETLHNMPRAVTNINPEYLQQRAWHAGHSYWNGTKQIEDVNSHAIGIVFVNEGALPKEHPNTTTNNADNQTQWFAFTTEQQEAFINLCEQLKSRYDIEDKNIVGHGEVAINPTTKSLGRKIGPGPLFPWKEIARRGIGVHHGLSEEELSTPCAVTIKEQQENLKQWGYSVQITQEEDFQTMQAVLQAQMHHDQQNLDGNCLSPRVHKIMRALLAQQIAKKMRETHATPASPTADEAENDNL